MRIKDFFLQNIENVVKRYRNKQKKVEEVGTLKEKTALEIAKEKAAEFYKKQVIIVAQKEDEFIAQSYIGIIGHYEKMIDENVPAARFITDKKFSEKQDEYDLPENHIIMVGDFVESRALHKVVEAEKWDYEEAGMKYTTFMNKTVIQCGKIRNDDINKLITMAKERSKRQYIETPQGIESIPAWRDVYSALWDEDDDLLSTVLVSTICSPLIVLLGFLQVLIMGSQKILNILEKDKLRYLQYILAFYGYLESENAIIEEHDDSETEEDNLQKQNIESCKLALLYILSKMSYPLKSSDLYLGFPYEDIGFWIYIDALCKLEEEGLIGSLSFERMEHFFITRAGTDVLEHRKKEIGVSELQKLDEYIKDLEDKERLLRGEEEFFNVRIKHA